MCGYCVPRKFLATLPDLYCTIDVMFYVRKILSDGAKCKVCGEDTWLVFREYMFAANKKEWPVKLKSNRFYGENI